MSRRRSNRSAMISVLAASCATRLGGALTSRLARSGSRLYSCCSLSSSSSSDTCSSCEAMRLMSRSLRSSLHMMLRSLICQLTFQGAWIVLALLLLLPSASGLKMCSIVAFCCLLSPEL